MSKVFIGIIFIVFVLLYAYSAQAVELGYTLNIIKTQPQITAWWNSENGWNNTNISSVHPTINITFNISYISYPLSSSNISWRIDETEYQNTSSTNFMHTFSSVGIYEVTAQVFNINGSSHIISIQVDVVSSRGGDAGGSGRTGNATFEPEPVSKKVSNSDVNGNQIQENTDGDVDSNQTQGNLKSTGGGVIGIGSIAPTPSQTLAVLGIITLISGILIKWLMK